MHLRLWIPGLAPLARDDNRQLCRLLFRRLVAQRASQYLPGASGFFFVRNADEAADAARSVLRDWPALSRQARDCAVEVFDSAKNLRKILGT